VHKFYPNSAAAKLRTPTGSGSSFLIFSSAVAGYRSASNFLTSETIVFVRFTLCLLVSPQIPCAQLIDALEKIVLQVWGMENIKA
jgi:hypothetical protein